ncbi:tetratricopeptide repeat protein [Novosphingobium huizhouense]|uniref:tetratricopeptide repeat protein n=1 Tax=Novosphingobium huizhouense TaxID=2866625 RepID=UPI001CD9144D|nr:tetratricopeptide repeat protein [Novosphingobium huizhouense]
MKFTFHGRATGATLALALLAATGPLLAPLPAVAQAQVPDTTEARLRKLESELRAVQRKVFPEGAGRTFAPEIAAPQAAAVPVGAPASTPVADLLARMDAVEAQLQRLTAASEESQDRMGKLEARLAALEPAPAPAEGAPAAASAAPAPAPAAAAQAAGPVRTTPAATTAAASPSAPGAAPARAPAAPAAKAPAPAGGTAKATATAGNASGAKASAERIAAVEAIEKPATGDAAEDDYAYGYRLWEAKFFPEAQQQLTRFVQQYPKSKRISFARNLLGRAYLDDDKPGTAAQWFLQNYQADKKGERAADSLLYLGVAMARLKETKRACVAYAEFGNVYPTEAAGRLKAQYEAATRAVTCN